MNLYLLIYIYIYIYTYIYFYTYVKYITVAPLGLLYATVVSLFRLLGTTLTPVVSNWLIILSMRDGRSNTRIMVWTTWKNSTPSTANNARPHAWTIRKSVHSGNRERRHGYTVSSTMGVQVMWQSRLCGSDISRSWLRFFFYNSSYKRSLLLRKHSLFYNGMLFGCDSALVQLRKCMW